MAGADYVVAFVTFLELLALPLPAILFLNQIIM
jgi:hypothetical protein